MFSVDNNNSNSNIISLFTHNSHSVCDGGGGGGGVSGEERKRAERAKQVVHRGTTEQCLQWLGTATSQGNTR